MKNNKVMLQIAVILVCGIILSVFPFGRIFNASTVDSVEKHTECFSVDEMYDEFENDSLFDGLTDEALNVNDVAATVTLSSSSVSILENETSTVTATTTPSDLSVEWSVSDTSVATVDTNGTVSGLRAGTTTLTASVTYLGEVYSKNCTVYVQIPNGCYFVKNCASNLYLTSSGRLSGNTDLSLQAKSDSDVSDFETLKQIFKIKYLGRGCYSIRPFNSLLMPVCADIGNVEQYESNYVAENILRIRKNARWMISRTDNGLALSNSNTATGAMKGENNSAVYAEYFDSSSFKWIFETVENPPSGVILYDIRTNAPAETVTRRYFLDEIQTSESADLKAVAYSPDSLEQNFTWSLSNSELGIIDSTGHMLFSVPGSGTITVMANSQSSSYNIVVSDKATVNVDALYDGGYVSRFPDYASRIENSMKTLKYKYLDDFGIVINYTITGFDSYSDLNCNSAYNVMCNHAEDSECMNSLLYSAENFVTNELHHKNITNNLFRIPMPDTSSLFKIAFLGHDYCIVKDGQHYVNYGRGVTYYPVGLIGIMNFYSKENEIKTLVHEFGHLYGRSLDHAASYASDLNSSVQDHFYDDRCIYGRYKNDDSVVENLEICDHCRYLIESNRSIYDHSQSE